MSDNEGQAESLKHEPRKYEEGGKSWSVCERCRLTGPPHDIYPEDWESECRDPAEEMAALGAQIKALEARMGRSAEAPSDGPQTGEALRRDAMSLECPDCERDLRGGHDPDCSFCPKCEHCGASMIVREEEGTICPQCDTFFGEDEE